MSIYICCISLDRLFVCDDNHIIDLFVYTVVERHREFPIRCYCKNIESIFWYEPPHCYGWCVPFERCVLHVAAAARKQWSCPTWRNVSWMHRFPLYIERCPFLLLSVLRIHFRRHWPLDRWHATSVNNIFISTQWQWRTPFLWSNLWPLQWHDDRNWHRIGCSWPEWPMDEKIKRILFDCTRPANFYVYTHHNDRQRSKDIFHNLFG